MKINWIKVYKKCIVAGAILGLVVGVIIAFDLI